MKVIQELQVRPISVEQARILRNEILRPGFPPETCIYPGDEGPNTLHCGAFLGSELVGIASIFQEPPPFDADHKAWRLRGMAVSPTSRRKGCGKALIEACLVHARALDGSILWCNARITAKTFYEKLEFRKIGDPFSTPESGWHYVMWREINLLI